MHDSGMGKGGNFSVRPLSAYTTQRWASTLTSRLNARHRSNTRPLIERSEISYILFRKTEGKDRALYRDRCQSRAGDPTLRKFLPKLKDKDLALYHDLCRSLSITISRDRFNVKKHSALYLDFSTGLR